MVISARIAKAHELPLDMSLSFSTDAGAISAVFLAERGRLVGTSFSFLRPTWVVTARHVVVADGLPLNGLMIATVNNPMVRAKVIYAHPEIDVAVLSLGTPICERPLYPAHHSIAESTGLIYGGLSPSKATDTGFVLQFHFIPSYRIEVRGRNYFDEETVVFQAPNPKAAIRADQSSVRKAL